VYLDWTPKQHELFAGLRGFALAQLSGRAPEDPAEPSERPAGEAPPQGFERVGFDRVGFEQCGAAGLLRMPLPVHWGGFGAGALETVGALEALGEGGADRGLLFGMGAHLLGCALPLARFGSAAQCERWVQPLAEGQAVGALAVTEPTGGSSFAHLATRLERADEGWHLRGEKVCVTHAPYADVMLVLAMQSPGFGALGTTMVVVSKDTPGVTVEPMGPTVGLAGAPMGRVRFDCQLPDTAVLGVPHAGFTIFSATIAWERACILGGFVGAARRDRARCIQYLSERSGGHGSLLAHPAVAARLARLELRLDEARWALYRACFALDQGREDARTCAAAKLIASEALVACAQETFSLLGGAGWCDALGAGTALRDVLGTLSASGSNDALLDLLARTL
jgi:alkylation response protein AidB-like acyl-CoA dehydrogenase